MLDRGILLSYIKYGDNDAILHCFTENAGFQSFFMRGIYSPKNKKKAYLTPMTELYFTISDFHKKYNIQTISKIEKVKTLENYSLQISFVKELTKLEDGSIHYLQFQH